MVRRDKTVCKSTKDHGNKDVDSNTWSEKNKLISEGIDGDRNPDEMLCRQNGSSEGKVDERRASADWPTAPSVVER